jgi:SAM-dependent methyltransferase
MEKLNTHTTIHKWADPIGAVCLDALAGGATKELKVWINDQPDTPIPADLFFRGFHAMKRYEKMALSMCRGRILDVGAGGGAHTRVLQRRGFSVVAVERSPGACQAMRSRGMDDVRCMDVLQLRHEKFDTILLLMNGTGIGGNRSGALRLLKHLKKMLNSGGQILTDSTDIAYFFGQEPKQDVHSVHEVLYTVIYGRSRTRFPWVFFNKKALSALAEGAGLSLSTIYTSDDAHFLACLKATNDQ